MFFFFDEREDSSKLDSYGQRTAALYKLVKKQIATPRAFALSMNEFWGDQDLLEAVHRIGGFPVTISLGSTSSVNYFVDFHSFDADRDLSVRNLSELRHEIRTLSELYAKQSSSMSRHEKKSFSLIIQQKINFEYFGSAYSFDPYLGREDIFLVEIFAQKGPLNSDQGDLIPHQYSVHYFGHKFESSEVGTGYVNFTNQLVNQFATTLLEIQQLMGAPQKIKFGVDYAGKLWICHLKNAIPILYGKENERFFAMDYFNSNTSFGIYSPLMFGLIDRSLERAIRQFFPSYHPRNSLLIQRFGRLFLNYHVVEELIQNFPSRYQQCILQALEFSPRHFARKREKADSLDFIKQYFLRLRQAANIKGHLTQLTSFLGECQQQEIKYQAYSLHLDKLTLSQVKQQFVELLNQYFYPLSVKYYLFCLLETIVRAELIDCLGSVGLDPIIDKDYLSGIGDIKNINYQNSIFSLAKIYQQYGSQSVQYQEELKKFENAFYYHGVQSNDLLSLRWGENTELLEAFFNYTQSLSDRFRFLAPTSEVSGGSDFLKARIYSLHPLKRTIVKHRADKVIRDLESIYEKKGELHQHILRSLFFLRKYLLRIASFHVASGDLLQASQIFFTSADELDLYLEDKSSAFNLERIAVREKLYAGVKSFIPPRTYGKKMLSEHPQDESIREGIVCSEGEATGRVYIVNDCLDLINLSDDAIIFAPEISADFSFVAGLARAVVLQHGNTMSAISVLSRKNGIPMIIRCGDQFKHFKNGDQVRIKAERGVYLVEALNFRSH